MNKLVIHRGLWEGKLSIGVARLVGLSRTVSLGLLPGPAFAIRVATIIGGERSREMLVTVGPIGGPICATA